MKTLLAAIVGATLTVASAQAAYFTRGEFSSALGGDNRYLEALPAAISVTATDAFGTRPASEVLFEYRNTYSREGEIAASFGCTAMTFPCSGAHTITYTFDKVISGLAGNLSTEFGFGPGFPDAIPFLEIPRSFQIGEAQEIKTGYDGFWGKTFAPTNTLTIVWPNGLRNYDDFSFFRLTGAMAVIDPGDGGNGHGGGKPVAVSEPATLALFGLGMLGLAVVRRKVSAA